MKLLKTSFILTFCFLFHPLAAHIGSPGVTLEGKAGPYEVMVLINPPEVIPGIATVDIYVQTPGSSTIAVKPVYWFAGNKGTPRADKAVAVPGEPGHYKAELWLMNFGTSSVEILVQGNQGDGKIIVPVMAISTAKKTMDSKLGWTLTGLGFFLVILMVTIISLSMSDSLVAENKQLEASQRKKLIFNRWKGAAIATLIIGLILYGGKSWWDSEAAIYDRYVYEPWQATTTIQERDSLRLLHFHLDDMNLPVLYKTRQISYLVPDHGKIMHMFLVKEGSLDAFAHIHPKRIDTINFEAVLPPLPAGKYFVYADITRLSGFAETIVDTVEIPQPYNNVDRILAKMHVDDTYFITDPLNETSSNQPLLGDLVVCGKPGAKTSLADGSQAIWELPSEEGFVSNKLYSLTFSLFDEEGNPAKLEPYLGMMGHAVVLKEDAGVYIHLHPVGNYSTASKQTLEARFESSQELIDWSKLPTSRHFADSVDSYILQLDKLTEFKRDSILMEGMEHDWKDPDHPDHAVIKFPYAFPSAGNYRIFIQTKRNGKILNSAFDVEVKENV